MKKCSECGANNLETETRCGACKQWLPQPRRDNLRPARVGASPYGEGRREGLRGHVPNALVRPTAFDGRVIWTGQRQQLGGFEETTTSHVLTMKGQPRSREGTSSQEYQCATCKKWFPRRKDDPKAPCTIQIDHIISIRDYVLRTVSPRMIDYHNHTWEVYFLDECKRHAKDIGNLQPMCSTCNASKGGSRDIDGELRCHDPRTCPACIP